MSNANFEIRSKGAKFNFNEQFCRNYKVIEPKDTYLERKYWAWTLRANKTLIRL